MAAVGGVATFAGLSLNNVGNGYTLQATSAGLSSVTTSSINVVNGAATHLVILGQPPHSISAGSSFGLTIAAEDAQGNLVSGTVGNVTVALANNPGAARFRARPAPAFPAASPRSRT